MAILRSQDVFCEQVETTVVGFSAGEGCGLTLRFYFLGWSLLGGELQGAPRGKPAIDTSDPATSQSRGWGSALQFSGPMNIVSVPTRVCNYTVQSLGSVITLNVYFFNSQFKE